ncbi:protein GRAVITROPIC IN THE LIGHT 1-like [Impatiens glandulifera]|uniref:protein GRAVITROPIC IN THE LIGHT 1-like n=1 Tax=Impatiens glandulifera TaxID=253017 RepID=UPI001FB0ED2D|nr:protein GRAVITROPIC IN THE LIGHT 1-like [Impatiens glandulifera]
MQPSSGGGSSRENQQQKVHPHPMEAPTDNNNPPEPVANLISKIFTNISSLKSAYIKLQEAHTPYDPDKIQAADKLVISELKILSELKHLYRENNPKLVCVSPQDSRLAAEIHEQQNLLKTYEVMVKKFQSEILNKDSVIIQLQQQIQEAMQRREKLEKNLKLRGLSAKQSESESSLYNNNNEDHGSPLTDLTPHLFISAVDAASKAIHDFSKPLINMMKAADWDLDAAANSIEPDVVYAKRSHKKYAFEAHICQRMFSGFQKESFSVKEEEEEEIITKDNFFQQYLALREKDPLDAVGLNPNSSFGNYCRNKYLLVVHPKMEASFFGNLDQRNYIMGSGHPQTPFYLVFLKLAKAIWLLHRLAYSFEPRIKIFQVNKGSEFSDVFMDSVVTNLVMDENGKKPEVGLMVLPGFLVGGSIIRSRVYLSGMKLC